MRPVYGSAEAPELRASMRGAGFVGMEIDPRYFDIACRRIEQAQRQPDMFVKTAPKAAQMSKF